MTWKAFIRLVIHDLRNHYGHGFLRAIRVFLFNQSFRLLFNYRLGHFLQFRRGYINNFILLILKRHQLLKRNCDIAYTSKIGRGVKFPHPLGIVIGENSVIGDYALIWHEVTLGSSGRLGIVREYPEVGDHIRIYPGAKLIGKITVGKRSIVAANAVVNSSIPSFSVAAGAPARVVRTMEMNHRGVPDFIIGGAMKCGTTFLEEYLRNHRDIFMLPRRMQFSYFDNDEIFKNGPEWYRSLFEEVWDRKLIGQTSADCGFNYLSAARIKQMIPDCKMIFVLRDPVERTYSQYWHQVRMGREQHSFERALDAEPVKTKKDYYHFRMFSYIERGHYQKQMEVYQQHFGESNLLIIPFEYMVANDLYVINKVFRFLGLPEVSDLSELVLYGKKKMNAARVPVSWMILRLSNFLNNYGAIRLGRIIHNMNMREVRPPQMKPETRKRLESIFEEDIKYHAALMEKWKMMHSMDREAQK